MTKAPPQPVRFGFLLFVLASLLGGCSTPVTRDYLPRTASRPAQIHAEVVTIARELLGAPYHYGGDSPRQGFDCSGLVYYAHLRAGVTLPRTSYGQYKASHPVSLHNLHPGDLVFFSLRRHRISHVGIYIGRHEFIHAPSRGKDVSIDELTDPYWRRHFVRGGRIL